MLFITRLSLQSSTNSYLVPPIPSIISVYYTALGAASSSDHIVNGLYSYLMLEIINNKVTCLQFKHYHKNVACTIEQSNELR